MKKIMGFVFLALAALVFSAMTALADGMASAPAVNSGAAKAGAALYGEIPDKDFPVPMRNGAPIPYKYVALPEPGYEATSYVYAFSGTSFMESYKEQLRKAGFVDQGSASYIESLWRYNRKSDGMTLMVEMFHEGSDFSITMYVNKLSGW